MNCCEKMYTLTHSHPLYRCRRVAYNPEKDCDYFFSLQSGYRAKCVHCVFDRVSKPRCTSSDANRDADREETIMKKMEEL